MNRIHEAADLARKGIRRLFSVGAWKEFHGGTAMRPDDTVRVFTALRSAGVRCKYKSVGFPWGQRGSGVGQLLIVQVHEDDLHRAREVVAGMRGV